jgi:uncharacterized protein (UPF0332 family)
MTADTDLLLEKARRNLEAAELLSQSGYLEIAASRAYYSMFYAAEALLLARGLKYSSHSAVIAAFGKEFAKTGALAPRFHHYLVVSQNTRNESDYGSSANISREETEEALRWAAEFINAAREFLA